MSIQLKRHTLTIKDYHRMAEVGILTPRDRVELIRGEIITMSPIGSKHAACVSRLSTYFIKATDQEATITAQSPFQIPDHSEPEPDLLILKYREDFYASKLPQAEDVLLLVEVSDSTLSYDRGIKIPLYAEAGIPEVWIFNLQTPEIEVYRSPQLWGYDEIVTYTIEDTISFEPLGLSFPVKDLLP